MSKRELKAELKRRGVKSEMEREAIAHMEDDSKMERERDDIEERRKRNPEESQVVQTLIALQKDAQAFGEGENKEKSERLKFINDPEGLPKLFEYRDAKRSGKMAEFEAQHTPEQIKLYDDCLEDLREKLEGKR